MRRIVYLLAVSVVAMMLFVPAAFAQGGDTGAEDTGGMGGETTGAGGGTSGDLPESGGPAVLLPAAALLVGSGVLAYAVVRRR